MWENKGEMLGGKEVIVTAQARNLLSIASNKVVSLT